MENEVSGIAKLGIVLIALAILIGLGFGIFQISKSVANDGVGQVQGELDSVGASKYNTYDQKKITGTMVSSILSDFEGENTAILIATQAWKNACVGINTKDVTATVGLTAPGNSAGLKAYGKTTPDQLPLVKAQGSLKDPSKPETGYNTLGWKSADAEDVGSEYFINYNALLGTLGDAADKATVLSNAKIGTSPIRLGTVTFDGTCYRYSGPFATDASGKVVFNNTITNVSKSGMTEYISSAAKFNSNLIKDNSGTTMGIAVEQIG